MTNQRNALIEIRERAYRLAIVTCPDTCGEWEHPLCWIARRADAALRALPDEPPSEQRPTAHLLTVATDVDSWTARCSCGAWKTEVTRFGRVEDWPPDQTLVDFRTWHDRHVQHANRPEAHE